MSAVPNKPLGLYDPAMDKDSCGVGFVAELSGESSRKTVSATTLAFACECEYEYGACDVRFYDYVSFLL